MNVALILAGGIGTRVGADCPKQFIEVCGKPILYYTIKAFQDNENIDRIVVVCHVNYIDYVKEFVDKYQLRKVKSVVEGGRNFQYSVINGLHELHNFLNENDNVAIHYGAAPFVSGEIINDAIRMCQEKGNGISGTPCYQLMGNLVDGKYSTKWVDRDQYIQIASPQCFNYAQLVKLYEEAEEKGIIEETEPHVTSLMYALGKTIYISKGNQTNIKITTIEDVELFKRYINGK